MDHTAFSETGHLCLTTLHASSMNQALDRSSTSSGGAARASR
jgi:Tfp pilus assembly ATPase PilU